MKKLLNKLTQTYKNFKIQKKLTISYLIIITLPMAVIIVFFFFKLYGMIVADTIRNEQNSASQTAPRIEKEVDEIIGIHDEIISENYYKKLVNPNRTISLEDIALSSDALDFHNALEALEETREIEEVRLYLDLPSSESVFKDGMAAKDISSIEHAKGTYWYGIFRGDPMTSSMFCPSFYLSSKEINSYGNMAYITKFSVMHENTYKFCYLAIYFNQDSIEDILKSSLTSSSNVAYIINDRNSIVAASDMANAGTYHFSYENVEDQFMSSNNFITKEVVGEEVYAGFYHIKAAKWYLVIAMPSTPMVTKSNSIVALLLFAYVLCILLALWLAYKLSHSLTRRLSMVSSQMTKAKSALPEALPPSDTNDEIGIVIDSYSYMTNTIHKLIDDLRIAEFNSLQAQINPHFLYNTMDMINWLANQGKSEEVTNAIQKLSKYYKLTLSKRKSVSTIANETEHACIYVELQNMRFNDQIDLVVDFPDVLMDYTLPKLTFQPVIENSILHGILEKDSKSGTIVLTGWVEADALVILISDDGVGMDEDTLDNLLNDNTVSPKNGGTNIAIYNTHKRIQVMYGEDYGLSYHSTKGEGTEVTIRLPALLEAPNRDEMN